MFPGVPLQQEPHLNNHPEEHKIPTFAFPVFILTYYFYSFKIVSIHNANGGIFDFQNEALALVANTAGSSSHEQMFV